MIRLTSFLCQANIGRSIRFPRASVSRLLRDQKMAFSMNLPDQTLLLDHQIAGHLHMHGKLFTGMLQHSEGYVMKPVQDNDRGAREIQFYEEVWSNDDEHVVPLRQLTPKFLGLYKYDAEDSVQYFIKMENIAEGFFKPCIADIKIGRQTWDPTASPQKILSEMSKYQGTRDQLGFCIPGLCVHDINSGTKVKLDKRHGRSLTTDTVRDALRLYLNGQTASLNQKLVLELLKQLSAIRRWFEAQRRYHFYATSVLLAYDASTLENGACDDISNSVRVRMIDFAHVHPADGLRDSNYIEGLENLITMIQELSGQNQS